MTGQAGRHDAEQQARDYLALHRARISEQVQDLGAGWHRATITAPHPGDPDLTIHRSASSPSRGGAIELARLELRGLAHRYFTDPAAHQPEIRELRDRLVYDHGTRAQRLVQAAVAARHAPQPSEDEVGCTWIAIKDAGPKTIGEIADAVIARRARDGQQVLA